MKEEEMTYKSETSPFWEGIKSEYPNHWVLIGNPVYKRRGNIPQSGKLLFASDKKDDLVDASRRFDNVPWALRYTGKRQKRIMLFAK